MAILGDMGSNDAPEVPATLGDVLYARPGARVPEREWAALVDAVAAGDEAALHALYERGNRVVFTLALRITANRETAEEVTVDVFHGVWRGASGYDPANGTVLGWIMNQARSRAIDRVRSDNRKKRSPEAGNPPPEEEVADPRDLFEQRAERRAVREAVAALAPGEREAIETTYFAGLTHAEAAARLDQPLGTIKTRIRSGLHKLRHTLAAEADSP
ncbi:MAG TPA: sigma-70 family RNA polymerase sigma factor [Croceibacterium sp.]|nr:sigma-70 family RNA polymerase sigma factor [Croceibacterium sp.]